MQQDLQTLPREQIELRVVSGWGYKPTDGAAYIFAVSRAKELTEDELAKELKVINLNA